jgi:hypothetical protein
MRIAVGGVIVGAALWAGFWGLVGDPIDSFVYHFALFAAGFPVAALSGGDKARWAAGVGIGQALSLGLAVMRGSGGPLWVIGMWSLVGLGLWTLAGSWLAGCCYRFLGEAE